jgi:hypothetical protein
MRFDNTHSPVALYHFDGNARDYSGNGIHFSETGLVFRDILPGVLGLVSGTPVRAISDALLRISGDITVQGLCVMRVVPAAANLVGFYISGETEPTNAPWMLTFTNQHTLKFQSEYGAGLNADFDSYGHVQSLPALGTPFLVGMRRRAGILTWWINGLQYGEPSGLLTTPTGGTTAVLSMGPAISRPECFGLKIIASALTDAEMKDEYNRTLGSHYGERQVGVESLWVGALTDDGATVVAKLTADSDTLRLVVTDGTGAAYSTTVSSTNRVAKLIIAGLDPDTSYEYAVQHNENAVGPTGMFHTVPSPGAASFTVAFAGDAENGSNHEVFDTIRQSEPLMFIHMGDMHYANIATNDQVAFNAALDQVLQQPRQANLYRNIPTAYIWDNHDSGPADSHSGSISKPAAHAVYRNRVPHYPLVDANPMTPISQSFVIGRVRFVITDQHSAASNKTATDNSSKTMLGVSQKAWFKSEIDAAVLAGQAVAWICTRTWGGVPTASVEHWGSFTTERTELANYIKANAPGRVFVLSADRHSLDIDNGTNHDFATGGGGATPTFQAAPLDKTLNPTYGGGSYSEGTFASAAGQYGTMEVTDSGGTTVGITWRGHSANGSVLVTHSFTISV